MFPSFLLALREGLEAALIIGIVFGVLKKLDLPHLRSAVWQGAGLAVLLSLVFGLGLNWLGMELEGRAEEIFEGVAMLFAGGVLTWMIFWMQRQGRNIQKQLESDTAQAAKSGRRALFLLAFLAVFREGIELALFLVAASIVAGGLVTLFGGIIGLATAVGLGYLLFATTQRLNLRGFFLVTSVLLIFFAAGLVAHGVHEFNEAGIIPNVVEHVWDMNAVLDENSGIGLILKTLFGYNGNPSLTEVIAYISYLVIMLPLFVRSQRKTANVLASQAKTSTAGA